MKLRMPWFVIVVAFIVLIGLIQSAHADNPILSGLCAQVDCLNNFTAKTGWSFKDKHLYAGGFTDLEKSWYLSPAPGFDVPIGQGPSIGTANLDINAVFKVGQLLSDKVKPIHDFVNSAPFVQGLMKYTTIGETAAYDYTNPHWYDMTWVGATVTF